ILLALRCDYLGDILGERHRPLGLLAVELDDAGKKLHIAKRGVDGGRADAVGNGVAPRARKKSGKIPFRGARQPRDGTRCSEERDREHDPPAHAERHRAASSIRNPLAVLATTAARRATIRPDAADSALPALFIRDWRLDRRRIAAIS